MKNFAWIPFALSTVALSGADRDCAPDSPAQCNTDACCRMHCMGPSKYGVNAPVNPLTCNGDFVISVAGLYWNAHQTGLEYAINTRVINTDEERNFLIDAEYKNPEFKWDFGFKFGLGYNTTCDGWDVGILWTRYDGKASSHNEAENSDNQTLLTLWSDDKLGPDDGEALFAHDIETRWKLDLNLIDIALGRKYWNSHRVALRPHIGLRVSFVDQKFDIDHNGGTETSLNVTPENNEVRLKNDFNAVGIRAGMDGEWNVGCGFAFFGNFALSLNNGRFKVDHDEMKRLAEAPFTKRKILETENSFRATRLFTDLALGVQYSALLGECDYGLTIGLGWEQHLLLDMNQFWRVVPREGSTSSDDNNIYHQRRGDLSTQGFTLTVVFDF
ncbi:MAG: Lpg1974 family pore-forming outer membrane protein [Simkaniaceae bacterium]|nr:Lpg1974 family pore-forming outer membrane protein [Candidatus Sacchlamyda saccharinae]